MTVLSGYYADDIAASAAGTLPWRSRPSLITSLDLSGLAWQDRALCAEVGPHLFFPSRYDDEAAFVAAAKAVCAGCPVKGQCLEDALAYEARPDTLGRHGVWGGTGPGERKDIARSREQGEAA